MARWFLLLTILFAIGLVVAGLSGRILKMFPKSERGKLSDLDNFVLGG